VGQTGGNRPSDAPRAVPSDGIVSGFDLTDYFAMAVVAFVLGIATVFLFKYPLAVNFATWGTVVVALGTIYHALVIRDDKRPDAC